MTYVIIFIIVALAIVSVRKIVKDRMLSRCSGCSGDCSCCNIKRQD